LLVSCKSAPLSYGKWKNSLEQVRVYQHRKKLSKIKVL
jgi:hypothetical protein